MTKEINLSVNDVPIQLDYFVLGFIDHTVTGMVAALEGTGEIKTLVVSIEGDNVTIRLNDELVTINLFVTKIIRSTIFGMLSTLKGVGDEINRVELSIRK
ncbi:hypothetical protein ACFLXJ_01345 [Chloroflexota bacterium]